MKALDRILAPVDFGPNTESVCETAAELASAFGARVRLMCVIEEAPHLSTGLDLLKQAAGERLAKLHDGLVGRGFPCEPPMLIVGRPFDAIVRNADASNSHLIVMGRGGCGDGVRPGLGTTTSRVIRRTSKPVLAVAPGKAGTIKRILCPVDGSNASARGLRNAILLASRLKANLTVLTVITNFSLPISMAQRAPDMARVASEYEKMERAQFEHFIKGFDFRDVSWDKEIHYGYAADEIVKLADQAKYDLVVMGSTGRSGLPRILLGSTAETVARRVPCSVLTVKRQDVLSARLEADVTDLNRLLAEGQELLEEGLCEDAIGRFDQCLLKDPYLATAIEGQATAHERLGHHDVASDLREQAALIRRELWHQQPVEEAALG
ncbi:MAG: universal stress protein [Planctomycetes bacterium]|nr:universal stress protein [Planctomycetota bacterium]